MKENIILTSYFTSKTDFQRRIKQKKNNFKYIDRWYASITSLKMDAIIFHDNLSDDFVRNYQNKYVKFLKVKLGDLSIYIDRFIVYNNFLKKNKYDNIFMTDVSDVWFKKNPFKLINNRQKMYVGSELIKNIQSRWMARGFDVFYNGMPDCVKNKKILNAGIIGGKYAEVLKFLDLFIQNLKKLGEDEKEIIRNGKDVTFDMVVLNKIIYSNYKMNDIYTGNKLHSPYKKYFKDGDYCIFHK